MINQLRKNKKGQFLARDWLMALVLFTGVIFLATLMVADVATDYNNTAVIDEQIAANFGDLKETTDIAGSAFDVTNKKGALTLTGSFQVLFQSAFAVISLIFNSISISTAQLASFGEFAGIPSEVSGVIFSILIALLTIVLVFVVISTTTRREL